MDNLVPIILFLTIGSCSMNGDYQRRIKHKQCLDYCSKIQNCTCKSNNSPYIRCKK